MCEWGGNVAACGLSQSITRHWEPCTQAAGHTALSGVCVRLCVGVCGLHAYAGPGRDTESVLPPLSLNPVYVIDPRLDI